MKFSILTSRLAPYGHTVSVLRHGLFAFSGLLLQNIIYFSKIYFFGYSFTGDFSKTYHAVPYCWMELGKLSVSSSWLPFAGMGYPISMNLQSGYYYPPYWLFVIFGGTYTFQAAQIMQCLHVFAGAAGMVFLARLQKFNWRVCFFAGFLYQGFGGFFVNSMHVDIVRIYAFMPWLLAPIFLEWKNIQSSGLARASFILVPAIVYLMWTGGYIGGTIAGLSIAFALIVCKMFHKANRGTGILLLMLLLAGCLMACIMLLPAFLQNSEFIRQQGLISRDHIDLKDIFSLIYNTDNAFFSHDPTMRSLYIGIPALALILSGFGRAVFRPIFALCFILSLLSATEFFNYFLRSIVPPLGYSRFLLSDYRACIIIPLFIFAVSSYKKLDDKTSSGRIRTGLLLAFICIGNYMLGINFKDQVPFWLSLAPVVILGLTYFAGTFLRFHPVMLLTAFCILAGLDWARVHWNHPSFVYKNGLVYLESGKMHQPPIVPLQEYTKEFRKSVSLPMTQRPPRLDIPWNEYCWRGYYSGEYTTRDWGGAMQFKRQRAILENENLLKFAKDSWMLAGLCHFSKALSGDADFEALPEVTPLRYGTNEVAFEIVLPDPVVVIENELYWKGWSALLKNKDTGEVSTIFPGDEKGFRKWNLPAGRYIIKEIYATPYRTISMIMALFGGVMWIYLSRKIICDFNRTSEENI